MCAGDKEGVWVALSFARMYVHHMAETLCDHVAGKLPRPLKDILNAKDWGDKLMGVMEFVARPALGDEADGKQAICLDILMVAAFSSSCCKDTPAYPIFSQV